MKEVHQKLRDLLAYALPWKFGYIWEDTVEAIRGRSDARYEFQKRIEDEAPALFERLERLERAAKVARDYTRSGHASFCDCRLGISEKCNCGYFELSDLLTLLGYGGT